MPQPVNNQTQFDLEKAQSKQLVVCVFWVGFCKSCSQMFSIFQAVESRFGDTARFFSINLDENPRMSDSEGILVVPTVILYKNGRIVSRMFGVQKEDDFSRIVQEALIS